MGKVVFCLCIEFLLYNYIFLRIRKKSTKTFKILRFYFQELFQNFKITEFFSKTKTSKMFN